MSTDIRPEISNKNKYWISRHRYYELKHFCLQYPEWKNFYSRLENNIGPKSVNIGSYVLKSGFRDTTADIAILKTEYSEKMKLIERLVKETDCELADYIFKAVTEAKPFSYLQTHMNIPCGRDTFYDRYRKFFWLLSKVR